MNDSQLRVLFVLPNLRVGGSQEAVRALSNHIASDHCTPVVCALFAGGPILDDLVQQGTHAEVLSLPRRPFRALPLYIADIIGIWQALSQVISTHRINVIQTYVLGSQHFLVLALSRFAGVPVTILNFRNERFLPSEQESGLGNKLHRLAYRLARRWASDYVAVSFETKQAMMHLLGLQAGDVTVILNGVEMNRFHTSVDRDTLRRRLELDTEATLILTVGTLKEQKGHRILIEAASRIVQSFPRAHFLFVGDGQLKPELQRKARACQIDGNIHFLGTRRDVADLLAASDVFVLPSLWEGLSMALLEAMAAAKPIVSTAVSGTNQVMVDGKTGILVKPGDAQELAKAIRYLLTNPAEAATLGEAARQRVADNFSMEKKAAEYFTLYRRLM